MQTKKLYLFLTGFFALLLLSTTAFAETQNINKTFEVKAGGKLVVNSSSGEITVKSWDKNTVQVDIVKRGRSQSDLDDFRVDVEQQGNSVVIEGLGRSGGSGGWGGWGSKISLDYTISVPKKFNLELQTGGGGIKVGDLEGEVKADTSGGGIYVGDIIGNIHVDTSGGRISVGRVSGEARVSTSGGSIEVRAGGKIVNADTSGGSIRIGPSEGEVRADTSGGSITIGHAKGDVFADTSGGSIRVEGSDGRVEVDTSGGSIDIDNVAGPIKADTSGGGIKIARARSAVKADTSGGDIRVEVVEAKPKGDASIELETSGGDITVYLPEKFKASITAMLDVHYHNKSSQIYSDFPLTIKKSDGRIMGEGEINGGGNRVRLRASNGNIYIRKLDP